MSTHKWRVERVGAASSGFGPGWIAMNAPGTIGVHFTDWADAIDFATRSADADAARETRAAAAAAAALGVFKLSMRGAR